MVQNIKIWSKNQYKEDIEKSPNRKLVALTLSFLISFLLIPKKKKYYCNKKDKNVHNIQIGGIYLSFMINFGVKTNGEV